MVAGCILEFLLMSELATRQRRQADCRAFSLVELVVVVVIIAVIAAIAVPRFSSASKGSHEAALVESLATLRTAIDMYAAEHDGDFPGSREDGKGNGANSAGAMINQLTKHTSATGQVADSWDVAHPFGPYLWRIPPAPVGDNKGDTQVAIDTANSPPLVTTGDEGWLYNPLTGQILVNSDGANAVGTLTFDEY